MEYLQAPSVVKNIAREEVFNLNRILQVVWSVLAPRLSIRLPSIKRGKCIVSCGFTGGRLGNVWTILVGVDPRSRHGWGHVAMEKGGGYPQYGSRRSWGLGS